MLHIKHFTWVELSEWRRARSDQDATTKTFSVVSLMVEGIMGWALQRILCPRSLNLETQPRCAQITKCSEIARYKIFYCFV